ncbi:signal recognition particle 19 kDa protein [Drosophila suzukii]|uniref:Signal recognition particle 19 kDa protein n=1 Tax=Drosophila suzukii TaxID=28584 RepID=A0AB39YZ68_DROSZ|nr:signal recognition particle 19 kDa protein [Drosophila suzukii]XP_037722082.1 signal recognition particle 19 kDa protein [Drosophila subpulchrella]
MAAAAPMRQNWNPSIKHNEMERWICIYPAYINSKRTRQEGRRLPKENCVDNPTYIEIRDVLSVSNLQFLMENMKYCREKSSELQVRGRVRVQLRNADGTLFNNDFPSRESIMLHIASKIPLLKTRQNKPGESYHQQSQPQSSASGSGGGGGGGKKGKGKRR